MIATGIPVINFVDASEKELRDFHNAVEYYSHQVIECPCGTVYIVQREHQPQQLRSMEELSELPTGAGFYALPCSCGNRIPVLRANTILAAGKK